MKPAIPLRRRTIAAIALASILGLVAFAWPFVIEPGSTLDHGTDAPWVFTALLLVMVAVVLAELADGGMDAKAVAMLGVLAAVGAALRALSIGVTGFTFMFAVLIPAGRVLGAGFGFVLGALTMASSALITGGVGPWLPFEMIGAAWVGMCAGFLPQRPRGWPELTVLAVYGAAAGLLYGWLLNLWSWPFVAGVGQISDASIAYVPGDSVLDNLRRFIAYDLATSLGFDIPRAISNAALVLLAGRPILLALRRGARRAAFGATPDFGDPMPAPPGATDHGIGTDRGGRDLGQPARRAR